MKHIWTIALLLITGIGALPAAWSEEDRMAQIKEQFSEYRKIQDERKKKMREKIKAQR